MKIYQLTIALLFTCLCTSAQEFVPGKVFTKKGEILQGFILDTGAKKMSETCQFKEKLNSEGTMTYQASEIQGYEVKNKIYKSKLFAKESGKQTNAFVLQLVAGKVSLYKYNGFLLAEKDNQIILLSRKDSLVTVATPETRKYIFTASGTRVVTERQHFRPVFIYQLDNLFVECANRHAFITRKTDYSLESITDVVSEYNQCIGN